VNWRWILDVEQRVGVAVQEEVDVGQHAGGGADHPAGVAEPPAEHGFRGDGAEEAVGQRVHYFVLIGIWPGLPL
jgi:hypothetical protein